ncbi:hypothetical protein BOX15_Mlig008671g2, partial [Macrostomum lignano]
SIFGSQLLCLARLHRHLSFKAYLKLTASRSACMAATVATADTTDFSVVTTVDNVANASEESNIKPQFYFENGLRKVYPYYFVYSTYTKRRWLGKKLKEVLLDEYRGTTEEAVIRDFQLERITINSEPAAEGHVLDHNEHIQRTVHRHELPVLDAPVDIVHEDSEVLVVNKPPGLPIHPCGRFNRNSLSYLLECEHKRTGLHIVHRLDRMTSGVLIIGKSSQRASTLSGLVRDRAVQKWYLARVEGRFPEAAELETEDDLISREDDAIVCSGSLGHLSRKLGLQAVLTEAEGGKPSKSLFRRLSYNGRTSLVECQPLTGRTHQLRVHLQYLGFPIANDPLYNSEVWGPEKGRGGRFGKPNEQLLADLMRLHDSDNFLLSLRTKDFLDDDKDSADVAAKRPRLSDAVCYRLVDRPNPDQRYNCEHWRSDPHCEDCIQIQQNRLYRDPRHNELVLFLHAARYRGPDFDYCAPLPDWADDYFDCSSFV